MSAGDTVPEVCEIAAEPGAGMAARSVRPFRLIEASTVKTSGSSSRSCDELQAAAQHFVAIVESSDDAIISKSLDGTVQSWNRAAERLFGYEASEMIGRPIRVIIPPDRQAEEDAVLRAIRAGGTVDHFETVRQRKDGTFVPISLTVSPIRTTPARSLARRRSPAICRTAKRAQRDASAWRRSWTRARTPSSARIWTASSPRGISPPSASSDTRPMR